MKLSFSQFKSIVLN
jgi:hypothetical protein